MMLKIIANRSAMESQRVGSGSRIRARIRQSSNSRGIMNSGGSGSASAVGGLTPVGDGSRVKIVPLSSYEELLEC